MYQELTLEYITYRHLIIWSLVSQCGNGENNYGEDMMSASAFDFFLQGLEDTGLTVGVRTLQTYG